MQEYTRKRVGAQIRVDFHNMCFFCIQREKRMGCKSIDKEKLSRKTDVRCWNGEDVSRLSLEEKNPPDLHQIINKSV